MHSRTRDEPSIVVIIVNYCTAALTLDSLRSLELVHRDWSRLRVIVADNASPDKSGDVIAEGVAANGWEWVRVLALPKNGGFSYGNNEAIRASIGEQIPDFFWLLNSDTIVLPGALDALMDFMATEPRAGIAGSRLENPDGTQQYSAFRFPSLASELEASARFGPLTRLLSRWSVTFPLTAGTFRADWLAGASLLVRGEVFSDAGLMDQDYFLYFEETDFCRRASEKGWSAFFVGTSRVVHLVGQSTGIVDGTQKPKRRPQYWFESRRRYFQKNHGALYAIAADAALAFGTGLARLREIVEGRETQIPDRFFRDLAKNSGLVHRLSQSEHGVDQLPSPRVST